MEKFRILEWFFEQITNDCRVDRGHVALYTTLYFYWANMGFPEPFSVFCGDMMPIAKISSTATYNRLIRQLNEFGYIRYKPSFNRFKGSLITFLPMSSSRV